MLQLFLERKILSTLSRYCSAPPPSLVQLCLINDFDDDDDDDDDNDNDLASDLYEVQQQPSQVQVQV